MSLDSFLKELVKGTSEAPLWAEVIPSLDEARGEWERGR